MATKRTQAVVYVLAQSEFISGSCDAFAIRNTTPKQQREIASIASGFWLARAFRDGPPQAAKCASFSGFATPFGWLGSGAGADGTGNVQQAECQRGSPKDGTVERQRWRYERKRW